MIRQNPNPANYADASPDVQPFNPQTFKDGTPVPWSVDKAEGQPAVLSANTNYLTAAQAADFSKKTGSAKLALAGSTLVAVGAIVSATVVGAVVGGIIALAGAVIGFAGKLFGNKFYSSTGVRWLIQKYQYYVEANSGVTSSNNVDESKLDSVYMWFQAVLGVPIYDKFRYHTLNGTDPNTGKRWTPVRSYSERAAEYLTYWDAQQAGVTLDQAIVAARIADNLQEYDLTTNARTLPGAWAAMPIAPVWFSKISPEDLAALKDEDATNDADVFRNTDGVADFVSKNKLPIILGIVAVLAILAVLYFYSRKKSN